MLFELLLVHAIHIRFRSIPWSAYYIISVHGSLFSKPVAQFPIIPRKYCDSHKVLCGQFAVDWASVSGLIFTVRLTPCYHVRTPVYIYYYSSFGHWTEYEQLQVALAYKTGTHTMYGRHASEKFSSQVELVSMAAGPISPTTQKAIISERKSW